MGIVVERLGALGIALPPVMPPVVPGYEPAFAPFVCSGNQVHLSGRLGKRDGQLLCGKVGANLSVEEGRLAAREATLELLAVLLVAAGDLDRVSRIVKLFVMVNCSDDFTSPHTVANGASELLTSAFGAAGVHARSAIGVAQVPFGACVEVELLAELRQPAAA
jgi:enamine deaminase RidA (YjgF/YER057c/UK114 family)